LFVVKPRLLKNRASHGKKLRLERKRERDMIGIAEKEIAAGECEIALSGGPGLWEVRPGKDGGEIVYLQDEGSISRNQFCVVAFTDHFSFFEVQWSPLGTPSIVERSGRGDWAFNPEDGSIAWTKWGASKGITIKPSWPHAYATCLSEGGVPPYFAAQLMLRELDPELDISHPTEITLMALNKLIVTKTKLAEMKGLANNADAAITKLAGGPASDARHKITERSSNLF